MDVNNILGAAGADLSPYIMWGIVILVILLVLSVVKKLVKLGILVAILLVLVFVIRSLMADAL